MTEWIIKFKRPLVKLRQVVEVRTPFDSLAGGWGLPTDKAFFHMARIRYWRQKTKVWTSVYEKADRYKSYEKAEARAFTLAVREPSLVGEIEVMEYAPVSKPNQQKR